MRYISTRGEAAELSFADALLTGLARDGGLYMPKSWPTMSHEALRQLAGEPYAEVAARVLGAFAGDALASGELAALTRAAYGRFAHPAITPLQQIDHGQRNRDVPGPGRH